LKLQSINQNYLLTQQDKNTLFLMAVAFFSSGNEFVDDLIEEYKKINDFSPKGVFRRLLKEDNSSEID